MRKPHCTLCSELSLGPRCPCQEGRARRRLVCNCGSPAFGVYQDEFGEWPMCTTCLALIEDGYAPLPLPVWNEADTEEELAQQFYCYPESQAADEPVTSANMPASPPPARLTKTFLKGWLVGFRKMISHRQQD